MLAVGENWPTDSYTTKKLLEKEPLLPVPDSYMVINQKDGEYRVTIASGIGTLNSPRLDSFEEFKKEIAHMGACYLSNYGIAPSIDVGYFHVLNAGFEHKPLIIMPSSLASLTEQVFRQMGCKAERLTS
jgi:hypothetical protein